MAAPEPAAVVPERHMYTVPAAAKLLSLSRSTVYELIRAGRLLTVTEGCARRVPAVAITKYVQLLISESEAGFAQAS